MDSTHSGDIEAIRGRDAKAFPPGTVLLEDPRANTGYGDGHLKLEPQPSEDPNDPLNWSNTRKYINFGITAFYTLMIFALLDVATVIWAQQIEDLGVTYNELNNSYAANTAGLAVGCVFFIPFSLKYGRRLIYIVSCIIVFAMGIWMAAQSTAAEIIVSNAISGLAAAVCETLVQLTVTDLFFIHQRGTMNGIYLFMTALGAYLAPVAAGYIGVAQGWRWVFWWCSIFLGVNVVLFIFFFEESKFIPTIFGRPQKTSDHGEEHVPPKIDDLDKTFQTRTRSRDDSQPPIPLKTYRQRMTLMTASPGSMYDLIQHLWQPFVLLFTFPIVTFTALQYGSILAWFSILVTTEASIFPYEPYNFSSAGVGLLGLPAFIGSILGSLYGGLLSDWLIIWLTKRNNGIYEPEMRLNLAILPALIAPTGLFLYGIPAAAGEHWIIPCLGIACFGFSMTAMGDIALTYLSDSHAEILGDALVAVAFVRNAFATIVVFVLTPWQEALGLKNLFICCGCIALFINLLVIPMMMFGKKVRIMCADRYIAMTEKQFDPRAI